MLIPILSYSNHQNLIIKIDTDYSSEMLMNLQNIRAYAAHADNQRLVPHAISRRELGANDVLIKIDYCGVCHTDIHFVKNHFGNTVYPIVPGHEIIGHVIAMGKQVMGFSVNETVGVGVIVDSCHQCSSCLQGHEQFCEQGMTTAYNSPDPHTGGVTYGGYSSHIVVDAKSVLKVSDKLNLHAAAPLLCAGITSFAPLNRYQVKQGDKVGIIGLGGLGHMGVKFAAAMGAHVVMITSSEKKGADAIRLGAHEVLLSTDQAAMQQQANSFDLLLNTIPVEHDFSCYLELLKINQTMVVVGLASMKMHAAKLIFGQKRVAGSLIGGIEETQQMLDFCAEHNITADVEVINIKDVNEAYQRIEQGDVMYRVVIDMATL